MDNGQVDALLRSLGDNSRRNVLRVLGEESLTVGEIVEVLGLPQSTVSRHLKTLRSTGLLIERREGNRVFVELAAAPGNGSRDLGDLLNQWLRQQPLARAVRSRLNHVVQARDGQTSAFDRMAHRWDELRLQFFGGLFHFEALASLLPREWRVLDIGTGTGYLLPFLSRHFRSVTAIDPSPVMLELARQRSEREGLRNVSFKPGRLEELPLPDGSVNAAVAILVLRHSRDRLQALGELSRVLDQGGRLLVVDVQPHRIQEFLRETGDLSAGLDPEELVREAESAGFHILSRRPLPAPAPDHPAAPRRPAPDMFLMTAQRR